MARTNVTGDTEDMLFRAFESAQGLERRIFRIIARGHFNEHAVMELRTQAEGIVKEIVELANACLAQQGDEI